MIAVFGGIQARVRIDMTMPQAPKPGEGGDISPWEREAYGEGGRFGSMTSIPSGDPSKDNISVEFCGCAYNTAKYLAKKGHDVSFFGVAGEDPIGMAAISDLKDSGINTDGIIGSEKMTSIRIEARNFLGDMEFSRTDEKIFDDLTPAKAREMMKDVREGDIAFADGSLPSETLKELGKAAAERNIDLYFDPSSLEGAERGAPGLEYFRGIMPGRREAEIMSGLQILSSEEMTGAGRFFQSKGIDRIAITIKGGGIYYREGEREDVIRPERVIRFAETSGAGDIASAEMLHSFATGGSMKDGAEAAMKAAAEFLADVDDERKY